MGWGGGSQRTRLFINVAEESAPKVKEKRRASDGGEGKGGERERGNVAIKKKEASVKERQREQQESFRCASKLMKRLLRCPQGLLIVKEGSIIPGVEI